MTKTIVFIGTYPPRECGIATFTQDLRNAFQKEVKSKTSCKVAALNLSEIDTHIYPQEVEWIIDQYNRNDYTNLADEINKNYTTTQVILQHEYGIYGGENGEYILDFLTRTFVPVTTTLHTVLPNPNPLMRKVTKEIITRSRKIIVLTKNSKQILESLYPNAIGKTSVIPHGIHNTKFENNTKYKKALNLENKIVLTTFGLLSRGKGIEYALDALPYVIKKYPNLIYLILGETHPVIRRQEGESYRLELAEKIKRLKLQKHIKFYDHYFALGDLIEFLKATDIYIATSTDPNQSVSGTLSYAAGTGRAIISTDFPQARELVTKKVGTRIPICNSQALTKALLTMLRNPEKLKSMHKEAYKTTRHMLWSNVVKAYLKEDDTSLVPKLKLDHLHKMTDNTGIFQFAKGTTPDKRYGYTLDDNARAAILVTELIKREGPKEVSKLLDTYLEFIKLCQKEDGTFTNYIAYSTNNPTIQNTVEDLEDAQARAMLALTKIMTAKKLKPKQRKKARDIFNKATMITSKEKHLRAKAISIKALRELSKTGKLKSKHKKTLTDNTLYLLENLNKNSTREWIWFEDNLNYNNAILAEALIIGGNTIRKKVYITKGLRALDFLVSKTFSKTYLPIGHKAWYNKNKKRSRYDQQPEDPAAMISALTTAYEITKIPQYKTLALKCFTWFLGNNTKHTALYDPTSGGCYDGLNPNGVNLNQGAESLLAYLSSNITIRMYTK